MKGQSPSFALKTDAEFFSQLKNIPVLVVLRSKTQNIVLNSKSTQKEQGFSALLFFYASICACERLRSFQYALDIVCDLVGTNMENMGELVI